jgi:hypothetical protein
MFEQINLNDFVVGLFIFLFVSLVHVIIKRNPNYLGIFFTGLGAGLFSLYLVRKWI